MKFPKHQETSIPQATTVQFFYLRQEGYVFAGFCLSVC